MHPNHPDLPTIAEPRETTLRNELSQLGAKRRPLDRELAAVVTREAVAADVARMREHAAGQLRSLAPEGVRSARSAAPGTPAWRNVEAMVTAAVLATPAIADVIADTLAGHLPSEADLKPKRDELARIDERMDAIDAELAELKAQADAAYLENAFRSRSGRS
jgi:hypothetical protein